MIFTCVQQVPRAVETARHVGVALQRQELLVRQRREEERRRGGWRHQEGPNLWLFRVGDAIGDGRKRRGEDEEEQELQRTTGPSSL